MDDHCTVLTNLIACFILNFPNLFLFVEWCRSSIWWFFMAYDAVMIFLLVSSLSNKVWNTTNIINKTSG